MTPLFIFSGLATAVYTLTQRFDGITILGLAITFYLGYKASKA